MTTWVLATIFFPLVGVFLLRFLPAENRTAPRQIALVSVLFTLFLASLVTYRCASEPLSDRGPDNRQEIVPSWPATHLSLAWLDTATAETKLRSDEHGNLTIRFELGLDGLGLWLFALSALLMVPAVLVSWDAISDRPNGFFSLLLVLETGMLGSFAARDIILFYIFFEATLLPLFFIIGIWGGEERRWAARKFFIFTLAGSVLTFLGLMSLVLWNYYHGSAHVLTFSIPELMRGLRAQPIDETIQLWIFLALFAGFAIKVPLFPLHTWLPLAHVEAPTAGSILLAGVLLKIGTYGFARFSLPMLPYATVTFMPWILLLAMIGIVYGSLVALAQTDIKKLIAYSSVAHMGFCVLGLFALNAPALQGSVLQMLAHGLSTGGLFAVVGMLYERYHSRTISDFSGLAQKLPKMAFFLVVLTFASIGVPGLCGFPGEFLSLLGMFQRAWGGPAQPHAAMLQLVSVLSLLGIVFGAWYMLLVVRRMFFGPLKEPHHGHGQEHGQGHDAPPIRDLTVREVGALVPLVIAIFWLGLFPNYFIERMSPTLDALSRNVQSLADQAPAAPIVAQPGGASRIAGDLARAD